jgi:prophage regulatory protein
MDVDHERRKTLMHEGLGGEAPFGVPPSQPYLPIRKDWRVPEAQPNDLCLIRLRDVLTICGKSRSSVYESIKKGEFPAPVKLCGRSSAWVKSEVVQWAQACIASSRLK